MVSKRVMLGNVKGPEGNGIEKIEQTSTNGRDHIYTISYTQTGKPSDTITVSDGEQGPQGEQGPKGDKGDQGLKGEPGAPFRVAKNYSSIAAMNADFANTDVEEGQFVMIVSDPSDVDNAKLYTKGESGFVFICDLSGQDGVQGETGNGISGVAKTATAGLVDTYTITYTSGDQTTFTVTNGQDGTDGQDGAPGAQGPKGEKGDTGAQGAKGDQGPQGLKGDKGETGPKGNYVVPTFEIDENGVLWANYVEYTADQEAEIFK